jgi:hypothetical protein
MEVTFWPDFDGMNIQGFETIIRKQHPAKGYCFLSLRQFRYRPSEAIFARRRKYVSGELRGEFCG